MHITALIADFMATLITRAENVVAWSLSALKMMNNLAL